MTILRTNTLSGIGTNGPVFSGNLEFNSQNYIVLPKGTTSDRVGLGSTAGALRYNTDSNKVELYDGSQWTEVQASRPDLNGGARGVFGGGRGIAPTFTAVNTIDFVNISSSGNSIDFGDIVTDTPYNISVCSSATRGLFGGGQPGGGSGLNAISFITISSTGNSIDFGDLTQARQLLSACSSSTRGVFGGGYAPGSQNTLDYITIASTGNAIDYGDLTVSRNGLSACSSPTRGIFSGGRVPSPNFNIIDYITISTLGNATDFGDLTVVVSEQASCSNPTRGLFAGGENPSPSLGVLLSSIQYITMSTLGNAVNFGSLTVARRGFSGCSSSTRGLFGGGVSPVVGNTIDYVTILTQGNSVDFGDLSAPVRDNGSCSNAHGGL